MPATSGLWDRIKGNWENVVGHAEKEWGKITHDELLQSHGDRDILAGHIEIKYGVAKHEAHNQLEKFATKVDGLTK